MGKSMRKQRGKDAALRSTLCPACEGYGMQTTPPDSTGARRVVDDPEPCKRCNGSGLR